MKASNQEMHPLHEVSPDDAIGMLIADHKRVAGLFAEFKRLTYEGGDAKKDSVVKQICKELTIHTQLEEEIFYPAVREAIDDQDQMNEALVEHAGAKQLIAQLAAANPTDDLYDAKVTVLAEQIDHHVQEEEGSMFPKARFAGIGCAQLGAAMSARKAELTGDARSAARATAVSEAVDEDQEQRPRIARVKSKKKAAKRKATPAAKKKRR